MGEYLHQTCRNSHLCHQGHGTCAHRAGRPDTKTVAMAELGVLTGDKNTRRANRDYRQSEVNKIKQYTTNERISVSRSNAHWQLEQSDYARKASEICLRASEKTIFESLWGLCMSEADRQILNCQSIHPSTYLLVRD